MRLVFATLAIILYICISQIWRLPCRPWLKVAAGCALVAVGSKYLVYQKIGGSFIAPNLPVALILTLEFLYSALILLAFLLLVRDCLALLLLASRRLGSSWRLPFTPAKQMGGLLVAALVLSLIGTWQAIQAPDVRTVEIPLAGLPKELDGFSLVQLTDTHIGLLLKGPWLEEVVRKSNALNADLVVLTGDMVDGPLEALANDIAPLRDLRAKYGVYGIVGNHEYYFGLRPWLSVFEELGIVLLLNSYHTFSIQGTTLVLSGITDQVALRHDEPGPDYSFLQRLPKGFHVMLHHRPAGVPERDRADLQLSGHTHGGQLFFLQWLIAAYNDGLVAGLYDLNGAKLYVNSGTGIWPGFSCRLGVPSEIAHIILRRE